MRKKILKESRVIFIWLLLFSVTGATQAKIEKVVSKVGPSRNPARLDSGGSLNDNANGEGKTLEVRGQARNLSMMLVLKNGKENINFIKVRREYRSEILNTEY